MKSTEFEQAKSDWAVIHLGRIWAERCNGIPRDESVIFVVITICIVRDLSIMFNLI